MHRPLPVRTGRKHAAAAAYVSGVDGDTSGLWRGVVEHLAGARAGLVAAGAVEWTGQAASAYDELIDAALRAVAVLRHAADDSWGAAARHDVAVRLARAAAP